MAIVPGYYSAACTVAFRFVAFSTRPIATSPSGPSRLIFPRRRGQRDYAAIAPVCDLNSNSIGLT
jgi:hypothetical protein